MVSSLCKNVVHDADNIECLHDWCKKRFEGMGEQLNGFFKEVSCLLLHQAFAGASVTHCLLCKVMCVVHAAEWIQ